MFRGPRQVQNDEKYQKQKFCIYFLHGICKNMENCSFPHIEDCEEYLTGECFGDSCQYSLLHRKFCSHFQKGECKSKNCPFLHLKQKEQKKQQVQKKQKQQICKFLLSGACIKDDCAYLHPDECDSYANGLCDDDDCDLLHRKICTHYQKGECLNPDCKLLHQKVQENCKYFMQGSCKKEDCAYIHPSVCEQYLTGDCEDDDCQYYHPNICKYNQKGCTNENCPFFHPEIQTNLNPNLESKEKQICSFYQKGKCTKIDCKFLHSETQPNLNPQIKEKPICKYYLQGKCTKSDCQFLHSDPKLDSKPNPNHEITDICTFYQQGKCTKIDCKYQHPEDLQPKPLKEFNNQKLKGEPTLIYSNPNYRIVKEEDSRCRAIFEDGLNLSEIIFPEDLIKIRILIKKPFQFSKDSIFEKFQLNENNLIDVTLINRKKNQNIVQSSSQSLENVENIIEITFNKKQNVLKELLNQKSDDYLVKELIEDQQKNNKDSIQQIFFLYYSSLLSEFDQKEILNNVNNFLLKNQVIFDSQNLIFQKKQDKISLNLRIQTESKILDQLMEQEFHQKSGNNLIFKKGMYFSKILKFQNQNYLKYKYFEDEYNKILDFKINSQIKELKEEKFVEIFIKENSKKEINNKLEKIQDLLKSVEINLERNDQQFLIDPLNRPMIQNKIDEIIKNLGQNKQNKFFIQIDEKNQKLICHFIGQPISQMQIIQIRNQLKNFFFDQKLKIKKVDLKDYQKSIKKLVFDKKWKQKTECQVDLNFQQQFIRIHGEKEQIENVLQQLDKFNVRHLEAGEENVDEEDICSICLSNKNEIILDECKHHFCNVCFKEQFMESVRDFQKNKLIYCCPYDKCKTILPLKKIQSVFICANDLNEILKQHFRKNLNLFQNQRYALCPTEKCGKILDTQQSKTQSNSQNKQNQVACNQCKKEFCTLDPGRLHPVHSPSIKCYYNDQDELIEHQGLQQCPKCKKPIFKDGGCRHMSCTCGCHFCSKCPNNKKQIFKTSDECYDHLNEFHGGIFDESELLEDIQPQVQRRNNPIINPRIPPMNQVPQQQNNSSQKDDEKIYFKMYELNIKLAGINKEEIINQQNLISNSSNKKPSQSQNNNKKEESSNKDKEIFYDPDNNLYGEFVDPDQEEYFNVYDF